MSFWQHWKEGIGAFTGLPDSTLHALLGMMILLAGAAVLRRVPWDWRPWSLLLALELINETYDMLNPASGEDRLGASLHDIWMTMQTPTLLLIFTPMLVRRATAALEARRARRSGDGLEQPLE
ncbi:hypothetical protein ACG3SL_09675 [Sphingomonas sp. CJ20]